MSQVTVYALACFNDRELKTEPDLFTMHVSDYDEACDDWRDQLGSSPADGFEMMVDPQNEDVIIQTDKTDKVIGYWTVVSFEVEVTRIRLESPGAYFNGREVR